VRRFRGLLKRPFVRLMEAAQTLPAYRRLARRIRPDIEIREATDEERGAVHRWFNPGASRPPGAANPSATNFVAKKGSRIVGFVQLVRHSDKAGPYAGHWLYSLRTRLTYRGMGLGEDLCQKVIDRAGEEGAKGLLLSVDEDNHAAIALYRKLGFERTIIPGLEERLEKEWQKLGRRRIVMRKVL